MKNINIDSLTLNSIRKTIKDRFNAIREDINNQEDVSKEFVNGWNELINNLMPWIEDQKRLISNSAEMCVTRFVNAELDSTTVGNRGIGRLSEDFPRFGANYRDILKKIDEDILDEMKLLFSKHILCGYLFTEYIIFLSSHIEFTRDPDMESSDRLFKQWVPLIFAEDGIPVFDRGMEKHLGELYGLLKGFWVGAFFDEIIKIANKICIKRNDYLEKIILSYFNAGILLRLTEHKSQRTI